MSNEFGFENEILASQDKAILEALSIDANPINIALLSIESNRTMQDSKALKQFLDENL